MIVTEMCVMRVTPEGLVLEEYNPEFSIEDIKTATEAAFVVSQNLKVMA
jgi:acetate CoA/acetoacetate CoA-transferase beta subunit